MAADNGALVNNVQLLIECAGILQKRSLIFQFSGLSTSGSFNCDKKKVLYFEKKDQGCVQTPVNDVNDQKDLALHGDFDQSTGKM